MRTVDRRSCSAISPNPGMAMSISLVLTFGHNNGGFLKDSAAHEFERKRFADGFSAKLTVNVLEPRNGMTGKRNEDVTNHDACFVRGAFGLHFKDDCRGFVAPLQRSTERFRQPHGLQAHAEVAARNAPFL